MTAYKCEECGGKMEYSHSDKRGDVYKCSDCANRGYYDGSNTPGSPVDESVFGF